MNRLSYRLYIIAQLSDQVEDYEMSDMLHHALIKLASYEEYGLGPDVFEKKLKEIYKTYDVKDHDLLKDGSYWLMPNGELVHARDGHSSSAREVVYGLQAPEAVMKDYRKTSTYSFLGQALGGAIRIFASFWAGFEIAVTAHSIPTSNQMRTLEQIANKYPNMHIEFSPNTKKARHEDYRNLDWPSFVEIVDEFRSAETAGNTTNQQPATRNFNDENLIDGEYQNTNKSMPYWKQVERLNLERDFPGTTFNNQKVRELYEKSASTQQNTKPD